MIPVLIIGASGYIVPQDKIQLALGLAQAPILGCYACLFLVYGLAYLPFGLLLLLKIGAGDMGNTDPRKGTERVCATSKLAARLRNCHTNTLENFPFFAAGVLAALQAGVPKQQVNEIATAYVIMRVGFLVFYIIGGIEVLSFGRTACW